VQVIGFSLAIFAILCALGCQSIQRRVQFGGGHGWANGRDVAFRNP
jgi:hypothetical protein